MKLRNFVIGQKRHALVWMGGLYVIAFGCGALMASFYKTESYRHHTHYPATTVIGSGSHLGRFDFIFATDRGAMMRYDGYIYYMKQGDLLPDGTRLDLSNRIREVTRNRKRCFEGTSV